MWVAIREYLGNLFSPIYCGEKWSIS